MSKVKTGLKPIDTPVFHYWNTFYSAFYSRNLYVDVGKRWRGLGYIYLLLVIALLSVLFSFRVSDNFNQSFKQEIMQPLAKLPLLYIQKGKITINEPIPYFIKNKKDQVVLIVDTSNGIKDFSNEYPYLYILINKNRMSFKIPSLQLFHNSAAPLNTGKPVVQKMNKNLNTVFDGKQFIDGEGVSRLKIATQIMIYPIVTVVLFSFFMVMYPVIALLGQTFSLVFFSFKISFLQSTRLLVVSSTAMLLLLFTFLTFNIMFQGMGFILLALLIAYYAFAIFSLKSESLKMVTV